MATKDGLTRYKAKEAIKTLALIYMFINLLN